MTSSQSPPLRVGDFDIYMEEQVGKGGFGVVYKARNIHSRAAAAAKSVSMEGDSERTDGMAQTAIQEIKNMQHVSMENLARLLDFGFGKNSFWLFVEFCNMGDLQQYFVRHKPGETVQVHFMVQMAAAVRYLHSKKMVHRDIKPQNVLINFSEQDKFPMVKIADFGLAKVADKYTGLSQSARMKLCFSSKQIGTANFMAPELYEKQGRCTESVDTFALGLTFFAMVCHKQDHKYLIPAEDMDSLEAIGEEMFNMNRFGQTAKAKGYNKEIAPLKGSKTEKAIRELIHNMIAYEANSRVSMDFVNDKVKSIFEEIKHTLPPPPSRPKDRGGAAMAEEDTGTASGKSIDAEDTGFKDVKDSIRRAAEEKKTRQRVSSGSGEDDSEMDMDQYPLEKLFEMLLKPAFKKQAFGFSIGDSVQVRTDLSVEKIKSLQENHGGWNERMREYLGKPGTVHKIVLQTLKIKYEDGQTWAFNPELLKKTDGKEKEFKKFDVVQIFDDKEVVKRQQKGHGEWAEWMSVCIGVRGIIMRIDGDGDTVLQCIGTEKQVIMNPQSLRVINTNQEKIEDGDTVFVTDDADLFKQLQISEHGGWNSKMKELSGSLATVISMSKGSARVRDSSGQTWWLNPAAVMRLWSQQDCVKHYGITCDGCGQTPMTGLRYKCKECLDYDICERCLQKRPRVHPVAHPLLQYRKSQHTKAEVSGSDSSDDAAQLLHKLFGDLGTELGALLGQAAAKQQLQAGDFVMVDSDKQQVMQRQEGHGNWVDDMKETLGKVGVVVSFDSSRNVARVEVDGRRWIFNVKNLSKIASKDAVLKIVREQ